MQVSVVQFRPWAPSLSYEMIWAAWRSVSISRSQGFAAMAHEKSQARVVVSKNGPYVVTGGVPLSTQTIGTDTDGGSETWRESGTFPSAEKYALCRCGHSNKKPFCDGTHAKIGFDGTETANRQPYIEQAKA